MPKRANHILRAAAVGVGYLGRFHAQKYAAMPDVELVAVVDSDPDRARTVAAECNTQPLTSISDLGPDLDIASVAVPTGSHHEVAIPLLRRGVHVLVEKPICATLDQARTLVETARECGRILQVGHLERFNPAVAELLVRAKDPLYIEAHRLANFTGRATDVDVVLDLMIHDLDILLSMVNSPLLQIQACGVPIVTRRVDMANARLVFADGCTANLTASRVSLKGMRKFRVFHRGGYLAADCAEKKLVACRAPTEGDRAQPIATESRDYGLVDNLLLEIQSFVEAVRGDGQVVVTGEQGRRALEVALAILGGIEDNLSRSKLARN